MLRTLLNGNTEAAKMSHKLGHQSLRQHRQLCCGVIVVVGYSDWTILMRTKVNSDLNEGWPELPLILNCQ